MGVKRSNRGRCRRKRGREEVYLEIKADEMRAMLRENLNVIVRHRYLHSSESVVVVFLIVASQSVSQSFSTWTKLIFSRRGEFVAIHSIAGLREGERYVCTYTCGLVLSEVGYKGHAW